MVVLYGPGYLLYFAKSEQIRWWYHHQPQLGKIAAATPVSSSASNGQVMEMMLVELRAQGGRASNRGGSRTNQLFALFFAFIVSFSHNFLGVQINVAIIHGSLTEPTAWHGGTTPASSELRFGSRPDDVRVVVVKRRAGRRGWGGAHVGCPGTYLKVKMALGSHRFVSVQINVAIINGAPRE